MLISYKNSAYRIYEVDGEWYNRCYEGLSFQFEDKGYYQFPIYLCENSDELIDRFNHCPIILKSKASYDEFVAFYTHSGLYRFKADGKSIILLGYADETLSEDELVSLFPLTIYFENTQKGCDIAIE